MRFIPLLFAVTAQAAPLKLTLDPSGSNPQSVVGKPGDAVAIADTVAGCARGFGAWVAAEPLIELTLKQPSQKLTVESSKPWAMVLPDGSAQCEMGGAGTLQGTVPAGVSKLYALGQSVTGAGMSLGYERGEQVSVQVEARDWPLRFDASGAASLEVTAEPTEPFALSLAPPQTGESQVRLECGLLGPKPQAVLEVAPVRAATLMVAYTREKRDYALVGPLDAPRAEQHVWCSSNLQLAQDEFLEGRYALFATPKTKGPQRLLLLGPKTQRPAGFRASAPEDLKGLPLEARVIHQHYPFFSADAPKLVHPADFENVAALWRAVPAELLVTPKVELTPNLLRGSKLTLAQGEPLLLLSFSKEVAEVLTLDGEQVKVSPKFLLAQPPASVVAPAAPRGEDRIHPDDDVGFEFVTDALQSEHARFKKLDEKALACWQKNFNPKGFDYDVVTYRNGEIVNVESLDVRFRKKAMTACKRDLDAAANAGRALRSKLTTVRKKRWEALLSDAKAAVSSAIASVK